MRWWKSNNVSTRKSVQRVLLTGSRGKSSVVRLLHAAMQSAGLETYARITGVVPRELGPDGVRTICRSSAAHVEEMHWWLKNLPASTRGIVMENSAITPDLQGLAARWLQPDITILTNTLPDHQEVWGPTSACAAGVLVAGIPRDGQVIVPASLESDDQLLNLLRQRRCNLIFAEPVTSSGPGYRAVNLGLALAAVKHLGLAETPALQTMRGLQRDRYDFHVARHGGAEVAMAFAVNDVASTRAVFHSLAWTREETRLIYNHRADRPGRFKSFLSWLNDTHWREVLIIGDRPGKHLKTGRYVDLANLDSMLRLFQPGDRIFGCGNIAGLPLSLAVVTG